MTLLTTETEAALLADNLIPDAATIAKALFEVEEELEKLSNFTMTAENEFAPDNKPDIDECPNAD